MRYVIIVALITGFLIWDGMNNGGQAMDSIVRTIRATLAMIGL